jgi:TolA-binding protein
MKGDLLSEATRALRENVDGSSEDPRVTEDRILALLPRRRRIRLVRPWGISLAAVLVGSSVWAMGGGAPIQSWLASLTGRETPSEITPAKKVEPSRRRRVAEGARSSPVASPGEPAIEAEPPPQATSSPDDPPALRPLTPPPPPPTPAEGEEPLPEPPTAAPNREIVDPVATGGVATADPALDVYERAHDLHFKQRDYAGALRAWEQYLALAPSGSLALEARFHRGVCLVRLGRSDEARRALEPFARGDYGTYRRVQARKLLGEEP